MKSTLLNRPQVVRQLVCRKESGKSWLRQHWKQKPTISATFCKTMKAFNVQGFLRLGRHQLFKLSFSAFTKFHSFCNNYRNHENPANLSLGLCLANLTGRHEKSHYEKSHTCYFYCSHYIKPKLIQPSHSILSWVNYALRLRRAFRTNSKPYFWCLGLFLFGLFSSGISSSGLFSPLTVR